MTLPAKIAMSDLQLMVTLKSFMNIKVFFFVNFSIDSCKKSVSHFCRESSNEKKNSLNNHKQTFYNLNHPWSEKKLLRVNQVLQSLRLKLRLQSL